MAHRDEPPSPDEVAVDDAELAGGLRWLVRLGWVVVPAFVAGVVASDLLLGRPRPWAAAPAGAALLALNAVGAILLARPRPHAALALWARTQAALVVTIPVAVMLVERDTGSALRYGVVVGVVGAAVALPRAREVAVVAAWALALLVLGDGLTAGFSPRAAREQVAGWLLEAGVLGTVALVAGYLHEARTRAVAAAAAFTVRAEKARREWGATFDDLAEAVVITDLDGVVTRANRAFARLLGLRPHDVAGNTLAGLLAGHPERWWSASSDGVVEIEDGVFDSTFELNVTRLEDRVIRVARDVGEARRLYARLVHADKLSALGQLAIGVAHEINNPTAVVASNLTELRRYLATYESALSELAAAGLAAGAGEQVSAALQRGDVTFARREAGAAVTESLLGLERIQQAISGVRSVARSDPPGELMRPVELAEIVEAVARTAATDLRAASARVEIRDRVTVLGNRGELVEVVLNLVVNAVQARDPDRPNDVALVLRREGDAAVVQVSDTGRGIPAHQLRKLFAPFTPGQGRGLGLSLAHGIVLAHGGSVDVQTEVGVGTTFTVRLPLWEEEREPAPAPLLSPRFGIKG
jgi:signal transduction histidine kinase